jgi:peptide/nickel transport system permease protein
MTKEKIRDLERKTASFSQMSQAGLIWYRFRKNKIAVIGMVVMAFLFVVCFTSPIYIRWQRVIQQNILDQFLGPSLEHPFGTDMFGRDMFARMLYGGMVSILMGLAIMAMSMIMGVFFGSIAGYFGGKADFIIMRVADIFMSIPFILLAMCIIVAFGQSNFSLIFSFGFAHFPAFSRILRASIMTIRTNEYIDAAKCYGTPSWKILLKHILPNCIGPVLIVGTLGIGSSILAISGMGFIGLGVTAPTPEWGTILAEGRNYIRYYPQMGIIPGLAIGLTVLCINFMGDGLRDALDPRTKK